MTKPAWILRRRPTWWPDWLCLRDISFWGVLIGLVVGGWLSWWISKPILPWLEFHSLTASYTPGSLRINLVGEYHVERKCNGQTVWRSEAVTGSGAVLTYGPRRLPVELAEGEHRYAGEILLSVPIRPDDWRVMIIVSCLFEPLSVAVSPTVPVIVETPWKNPDASGPAM